MEAGPEGLSFLMASPAKAICDKLVLTRRLQAVSVKSMRVFLFEDLRLEPEAVRTLDQDVIRAPISRTWTCCVKTPGRLTPSAALWAITASMGV
jgi:hypothetical protein